MNIIVNYIPINKVSNISDIYVNNNVRPFIYHWKVAYLCDLNDIFNNL